MPKVNLSKRPRSLLLRKLFWTVSRHATLLGVPSTLKNKASFLHEINARRFDHQNIRQEFKLYLADVFKEDVQLLSTLLSRDFSSWLDCGLEKAQGERAGIREGKVDRRL